MLGWTHKQFLVQAACISLGLGAICTLTARLAPNKFFLRMNLLMGVLAAIITISAIGSFAPNTAFRYGMQRLSLYGELGIFSAYLMLSTHQLFENALKPNFDSLGESTIISSNFLNLFLKVLELFNENRKKQL